ncbi:hypothetical protein SDC9_163594 [bioreactor metagenome]|uniref:Uncharacterized protein n=1 Tax=bioreactor metagenome TaxID=1076179 RepID=A0A645FRB1_9ZZZZ
MGGIVDDILNPAYTSTIGLLMTARENKEISSPSSSRKMKLNFGGLFGRVKKLIEPILP